MRDTRACKLRVLLAIRHLAVVEDSLIFQEVGVEPSEADPRLVVVVEQ